MNSFADEFRAEAKQKTGEPVFRNSGGWSFGLSYGPVRAEIAADAVEQSKLRIHHDSKDVTDEVLTRLRSSDAKDAVPQNEWMFSAKLQPVGRSSTDKDWTYLGTMCSTLQIPMNSLITPFETTDPNATHYWIWKE